MSGVSAAVRTEDVRVRIQGFGAFLASMVMPNIGAFIAWGLITAFFIPSGWMPNAHINELVKPMITYLLPLLIAYTGGHKVYGLRGGFIGATVTMGAIVGTEQPMFLAAMILGPGSAWAVKKVDALVMERVKPGLEMLVNNYIAGIMAMLLAIAALYVCSPVMGYLSTVMADAIEAIISWGVLPLAQIVVEPVKVLFLNNALNHGIITPLGIVQVQESGKSVLFLLDPNPGTGLGLLLAYAFFGKGTAKKTAPGAMIIHFFGGIHEVYFPYVLMKPSMLVAMIIGGISGTSMFVITGAGLVGPASPGSIISCLTMAAKGSHFGVLAGVCVSAVVTCIIASLFLRFDNGQEVKDQAVDTAEEFPDAAVVAIEDGLDTLPRKVRTVVFACDAGMGSSAMGAKILRDKFTQAGLEVVVTNTAIAQLPEEADVVITHQDLTSRARKKNPWAYHISVTNFLAAPEYEALLSQLQQERLS